MGIVGLAILLFIGGMALLILDIVAPSHFMLTLVGLGCLAGGVGSLFTVSQAAGWVSLILVVVVSPVVILYGLKLMPHTGWGKRVIPPPPPGHPGSAVPDAGQLHTLLGLRGQAVTPLRPAGICKLLGERIECVAEGKLIDAGEEVEVIQVEASRVVVRKV